MYLYVFIVWVGSGPGVAGVKGTKSATCSPLHVPRYSRCFPVFIGFEIGFGVGVGK